jgi:DNA-binding transcriptional LysR family regulator
VRIDRRWLPLNALRAFEAVAQHLSFTAAAQSLLISQSALSRHVISLEKLIGVQLFDRKPQSLTLTDAGQHLLPVVTKALDRMEYAIDEIREAKSPSVRTLRVTMPPSFAMHLAVPLMRNFRSLNPEIEIDLHTPYGTGLPTSDVDVAVIYSKPQITSLVTDLLWPEHLGLLCHPSLLERHKNKPLASFLQDNELLHIRIDEFTRHYLWSELLKQEQLPSVNADRGLVFDTAQLAVQYALSGEGIALVDLKLFEDEIKRGSLVQPFDVQLDAGFGYYLVTHSEALSDTAVSIFRNWLIDQFGTLEPNT